MTVSELLVALRNVDPSTLITIDTLGFPRGHFPIADAGSETQVKIVNGERYHCIILEPSRWP